MINLKNKIIFLTGSNGELGKFVTKEFIKYGVKLILTDIDNKSFIKSKNILGYYKCDFSSREQKNLLFQAIKKKYKKIDILINNAALTGNQLYKERKKLKDLYYWDKAIEINLTSTNQIISNLKPLLLKSNTASIINISSIHGMLSPDLDLYKNTSMKNYASYSITKSSIIHLTKWYAAQFAPKIRVNCISPGGVYRGQPKIFTKRYLDKTPMQRMTKLNDIFGSIVFLSSNLSSYITGQNIIVDGGYSIK